jgi:glycosyltransferase involved in cell wall biosynthesis
MERLFRDLERLGGEDLPGGTAMGDPVFAFLAATSGSYEGAIIRDMRLANEFHRRGHSVVVYWMVQQNRTLVAPGIRQRVLCRALRYGRRRPGILGEFAGALFDLVPAERRVAILQTRPGLARRIARNLSGVVCDGGRGDPRLVRRLERFMQRDGVTHLVPTFAFTCPFALAVKRRKRHAFDYLVTFQGEELFEAYAAELGRREDYCRQLREVVDHSPWKAIAVSRDYIDRLRDEMGIDADRMVAIPPGIEVPAPANGRARPDFEVLRRAIPGLRPDVPIVAYVGRNDAEKGIDLLLYAARILRTRRLQFQLVIAGNTTFGPVYRSACEQIAAQLRLDVHWQGRIAPDVREALYAHSHCIVYPPVHREPFGMVAPEALVHGTPVLVPNHGGMPDAIGADGRAAGLTFEVWDSGSLAHQLERLLLDEVLHRRLAANAQCVAEHFSVERLADRVLAHLGTAPCRAERQPRDEPGTLALAG